MSKYITNLVRTFKAGSNNQSLLVEEAKSLDFQGPVIVSATMSAPNPGGPVGMISRILDDAASIDSNFEAIQTQMPQRQDLLQQIGAACTSTRMHVLKVHRETEYAGSNPPTVLVRNFIRAKRGHLDELLETVTSFIDGIPSGRTKGALTETTTGRYGLITISVPYESNAAAQEGYEWVRAGGTSSRAKRMADITQDSARVPFRIFHSNVEM